jgi:hypothetical protein
MPKIKNRTAEFKDILFYKGHFILVYNDGSYNIAKSHYYTSMVGDLGIDRAVSYIDTQYDVSDTELNILSIEREIEGKQKRLKELKDTLESQKEALREITNKY